MKIRSHKKTFAMFAGTAFASLTASSALAQSSDELFVTDILNEGYLQIAMADAEGKCGEGKCGASGDTKSDAEGKCGEGKCGATGETKSDAEGKCGEGKCGASGETKGDVEGKCGEGKCGGAA